MRFRLWPILLAFAAGCAIARPGLQPATGPDPVKTPGSGSAESSVRPVATPGSLRIVIRWPERDHPGFRAAAIPGSTQAIEIVISKGADQVFRQVLSRPGQGGTSEAVATFAPGTDLSVQVLAFRTSDLTGEPIARGTATGVAVMSGKEMIVRITLDAMFTPAITALSAASGKVGDALTVTGMNLDPFEGVTPSVTFGGRPATQVLASSTDSLRVIVPTDATVGKVVITRDGVPSTSNSVFWVLDPASLSITAPKATADPTPANTRLVLRGTSRAFVFSPWILPVGKVVADFGSPPASWSLGNAAVGTIAAAGQLSAGSVDATSSLFAEAGFYRSDSLTIAVAALTGFAISPASPVYGPFGDPAPATVAFSATATLSTGVTASPVFSTTASPATMSLSTAGMATIEDTASPWRETITATLDLGTVFVASASITNTSAVVATIAGSGTAGFQDGTGTAAMFSGPYGVAVDATGNIFVADFNIHCIRKISPAGAVTILAGSGTSGFTDGTGTAARFNYPRGVAVDATGNVFVADTTNHRIRKITPAGAVTTLAGSSNGGFMDGTGAAANFNYPYGVAVDAAGNVFVADYNNLRIRKISSVGAVTTLAGSGTAGFQDGTGTAAMFSSPIGVAVDAAGNVFVADSNNHRIRKISPAGAVTTLAGSSTLGFLDGTGAAARFFYPFGVAIDATGNVVVGDSSNYRVRKVRRLP